VLEIWLDYRRDIVVLSQSTTGWKRWIYRLMTLGSSNISKGALAVDERVGWVVTLIGIPSAFLLHGYVGFIFGSVKANPWWSSPLMPVVFIFSAMVSGIAAVMRLGEMARKRIYVLAGCLTLIGIFAMRWNVVIGGQLFSKSFLGYTTYKM